ncbi:MAG: hypothetical protein WDA03_04220 [Trueperaceae bacterium]
MSARLYAPPGRSHGFVLVAVLGGLLIVAAVAFAMLFTASLESMAVRARQEGVIARAALEGALALTLAELEVHGWPSTVAGDEPGTHGPWPQHGLPVRVTVQQLTTDDGSVVVRLTATYAADTTVVGVERAQESMIVQLQPELAVLRR